jgi:hypothetical protein
MASTDNSAPIPEYAEWMFQSPPDACDLPDFKPRDGEPPRSLWDLPIFAAFWCADSANLNR